MPALKPFALLAIAALAGCGSPPDPPPRPEASPSPASVPPSAEPPASSPSAVAAGLDLPVRFEALGTEPFWAAQVDGDRLTYLTPEDQTGQTIAVRRSAGAEEVELSGMLGGDPLVLTISAGPCSDGMSDVVYPFTVRRRLGDDEQRGCARSGQSDAAGRL